MSTRDNTFLDLFSPFSFFGRLLDKESLSPRSLDQDFCSTNKVGEDKGIPRLFPIWATCLVFAIVYAQVFTLFTEQEVTMDESIGPNFKVPAASLLVFISLSTVILIPIYDRILVPFARAITGKPSGIMMLQRIGTGLVFSPLSMVIVAVFEMKHLETAQKYGLVNMLEAIVPMSIWWLIPQYLLFGIAEVFAYVGLQEFFYDKVVLKCKFLIFFYLLKSVYSLSLAWNLIVEACL